MADLGAGVHEHDDPPANGRVGPAVPRARITCPACGLHDAAERIEHPEFPFFCGACSTLFTGTELEWRRMRTQRETAIKRREDPPAPMPPMRSRKSERVVPVQQRVQGNDPE